MPAGRLRCRFKGSPTTVSPVLCLLYEQPFFPPDTDGKRWEWARGLCGAGVRRATSAFGWRRDSTDSAHSECLQFVSFLALTNDGRFVVSGAAATAGSADEPDAGATDHGPRRRGISTGRMCRMFRQPTATRLRRCLCNWGMQRPRLCRRNAMSRMCCRRHGMFKMRLRNVEAPVPRLPDRAILRRTSTATHLRRMRSTLRFRRARRRTMGNSIRSLEHRAGHRAVARLQQRYPSEAITSATIDLSGCWPAVERIVLSAIGPDASTGVPPTDAELAAKNVPPLRGGYDPNATNASGQPLSQRAQTELELSALESSYSGWVGGIGVGRYRSGTPGLDRLTEPGVSI